MRRRARLVGILWRWHRRLGLAVALLVLLLALTGIALNHTSLLGLDRGAIQSRAVFWLYGVEAASPVGYRVGQRWLSRTPAGGLYLDGREVAHCRGQLSGALELGGVLYAGCSEELLLLTPDGELIESVSAAAGLPTPLTAVGAIDASPALATPAGWRRVDIDRLEFQALPPGAVVEVAAEQGPLPEALLEALPRGVDWLTWERVLLDLHTGRLAGPLGVALVDALGVVLCLLAVSGFAIWWMHHRRTSRRAPGRH
jgi:hypothetical protein